MTDLTEEIGNLEFDKSFSLEDAVEIAQIGIKLGGLLKHLHEYPEVVGMVPQLFEDMYRYKSIFEPVLQEIYNSFGSGVITRNVRDYIGKCMEQNGFEVPDLVKK